MILSKNHTIKILILFLLLSFSVIAQQDSLRQNSNNQDSVFVMTKSPWGAVLRSAIIPGWGQLYNESYWKAPVVFGLSAWLIYNWIDNNNLYNDYREIYISSLRDTDKSIRNFYRDQRDLFAIYMGLTYVLTLVDAYVDAHLFDFTVEEDFLTKQPMLGIRFNF